MWGTQAVFTSIKWKDVPVDTFTMRVVLDSSYSLWMLIISNSLETRPYKPARALHLAWRETKRHFCFPAHSDFSFSCCIRWWWWLELVTVTVPQECQHASEYILSPEQDGSRPQAPRLCFAPGGGTTCLHWPLLILSVSHRRGVMN